MKCNYSFYFICFVIYLLYIRNLYGVLTLYFLHDKLFINFKHLGVQNLISSPKKCNYYHKNYR